MVADRVGEPEQQGDDDPVRDERRTARGEEGRRESREGDDAGDASDDVKAKFVDGVLVLTIPKAEERKPRVVRIES